MRASAYKVSIGIAEQCILSLKELLLRFSTMAMDRVLTLVLLLLAAAFAGCARAQLSSTFYAKSCSNLVPVVRGVLQKAVQKEARIAASLLRLHFHDCFVNGCDASILLDDTGSFTGEKTANPNRNSARGFNVVDDVKTAVEKSCPGIVSCADVLAVIARESVVLMNGPSWPLSLGRRDSTTASLSTANNDIPAPNSTLAQLASKFQAKGLGIKDLVALSGSHTIGQARCVSFRDRLYNFGGSNKSDPTLQTAYASNLQQSCTRSTSSDNAVSPLDVQTPVKFDQLYFANLRTNRGLLNSDQVLYSTASAAASRSFVSTYAAAPSTFFRDFANAMVKMGNISPLTGSSGEIRKNCRVTN